MFPFSGGYCKLYMCVISGFKVIRGNLKSFKMATIMNVLRKDRMRVWIASPFVIWLLFAAIPIVINYLRPGATGYIGAIVWGLPSTVWPYFTLGWWFNRSSLEEYDILKNWKKGLIVGVIFAPSIFFLFFYLTPMAVNSFLVKWFTNLTFAKTMLGLKLPLLTQASIIFAFPGDRVFEALVEEVFYRGLLLTLLQQQLKSNKKAVLWSAFLFAIAHNQVALMPYFFIWGVCVGLTYVWTGSLFAPILIHMFNNGFIDFKIWLGDWQIFYS